MIRTQSVIDKQNSAGDDARRIVPNSGTPGTKRRNGATAMGVDVLLSGSSRRKRLSARRVASFRLQSQDAVSIFALTVGDAAKVAEVAVAFDGADCYARRAATPFAVEESQSP